MICLPKSQRPSLIKLMQGGALGLSTLLLATNVNAAEWQVQIVPRYIIAQNEPAQPVADSASEKWNVEITPRYVIAQNETEQPAAATVPEPPPAATDANAEYEGVAINPAPVSTREFNAKSYVDVYNSIPFSRSEYDYNPGYRHEATMELLLGQVKTRTIIERAAPAQQTWYRPAMYTTPYRTFYGRYGVNFNLWWRRVPLFYYPY